MAKKKDVVEIIALQCETCKRRNYSTTKNRKNSPDRLEVNKFCKYDRKHTVHKEVKR
ncbi:MAG: 50S ribosomal protein L33 [Candidatus Omnitrophica bacterium]|nr:50S ribosomal protein L33 [Candidatus Omnitrophota bacterium]MDD5487412.1 50S ribosomal protein L33 [Candidatus Omnitrophota bacterium]